MQILFTKHFQLSRSAQVLNNKYKTIYQLLKVQQLCKEMDRQKQQIKHL